MRQYALRVRIVGVLKKLIAKVMDNPIAAAVAAVFAIVAVGVGQILANLF